MLGGHGFVKFAFGQFRIVDAFRSRLQLLLLLVSSANRLPSVTTGSTSVMKVIHGGDMAYEARKGLF